MRRIVIFMLLLASVTCAAQQPAWLDTLDAATYREITGPEQTFDLNGYDQTIGPMYLCGPNYINGTTVSTDVDYIKSESPAVLTIQVDDNNNRYVNKGPVKFQGALKIVKTGSGTQTFSNPWAASADVPDEAKVWGKTTTDELTGGIEVLEGRLNLNNELNTAKITVDGGTLAGATTLKYTATKPETFVFTNGTCDVSHMSITFSDGEVPYGSHLVFDASASTAENLTVASGEYWPFAGIVGDLPKGCRWRYNATQRKAYLVHPQPGLFICVR